MTMTSKLSDPPWGVGSLGMRAKEGVTWQRARKVNTAGHGETNSISINALRYKHDSYMRIANSRSRLRPRPPAKTRAVTNRKYHGHTLLDSPSMEESDMSVAADSVASPAASRPSLGRKPGRATILIFLLLLIIGAGYTTYSLITDISTAEPGAIAILPFLLLGLALLIALGFEFVNGFHDTANAVATVIYTHSLPPNFAVLYSGTLNFLGVLFSSGAVAFGIISLLPVELILQVGSGAGFAMVFALLIAAIIWNLGTWWLGLPASSSHTLIGSIIGVGVANALMHGRDGT